jgi:HAD superfamily hydrolase (TIGR01509 family)
MSPIKPLPSLKSIKGVLFDIDGTLSDTDGLHFMLFRDMLQKQGFNNGEPITEAYFKEHISGGHNPILANKLFPDMPFEDALGLIGDKEVRFRELAGNRLQPTPGLIDFLSWMDQHGVRRVAVTNAPGLNAASMLKGLGLEKAFEAVVLGEECARGKPYPDPYLEGLRLLGLTADQCIAVEDSVAGVTAGVAAGIPVVGITTTQSEARLREVGCSHVITSFHDLLQLAQEA